MKNLINVAVLGSTGYTGLELINILLKHPSVSIKYLGSENNAGKYINLFDERLKNLSLPKLNLIKDIDFSKLDVVFFSLPHNISQNIIKENFGKCKKFSKSWQWEYFCSHKKNYSWRFEILIYSFSIKFKRLR